MAEENCRGLRSKDGRADVGPAVRRSRGMSGNGIRGAGRETDVRTAAPPAFIPSCGSGRVSALTVACAVRSRTANSLSMEHTEGLEKGMSKATAIGSEVKYVGSFGGVLAVNSPRLWGDRPTVKPPSLT